MTKIKVVVVTILANPTCTNWIIGLKKLGYSIVVLDWRKSPASNSELSNWGFQGDEIPIVTIGKDFNCEQQQTVNQLLGGSPDILLSWEGAWIFKALTTVKKYYPHSKIVHSVNTYPNAINAITEIRLNWRYRCMTSIIDGYIFYSNTQRQLFIKNIPQSAHQHYLTIVEPFFEQAYFKNETKNIQVPHLKRFDTSPHIIYTGRASELWHKYSYLSPQPHRCRDALGEFFQQLSQLGVHIFLPPQADIKNIPNLHRYPSFSNEELFTGIFAEYISQFDAHLVLYNEYNDTMRRWVASGLATRFAYSLTSTTPLAVTKTSKFVEEYWQDTPFGFTFTDAQELATTLQNRQMLSALRMNMEQVHTSFSFESQSSKIDKFMHSVLDLALKNNSKS